jgi:hypothetical protein
MERFSCRGCGLLAAGRSLIQAAASVKIVPISLDFHKRLMYIGGDKRKGNAMNATSRTNFGVGVYGYEMHGLEATMICAEHVWDGNHHTRVERKIPVRLGWVGIRSAGRTGYYIIYFDGVDQTNLPPEGYRAEGKRSQYRCDSIMAFRVGERGLKKVLQEMVEKQ